MGQLKPNDVITKVGNLRYRQLQVGSDYYLLDLDTHIWTWLIPTSVWWFPMRAYKLERAKSLVSKKQPKVSPYLVSSLVTVVFTRFPIYFSVNNRLLSWTILLIICLSLFIARLVWSKRQSQEYHAKKMVRINFSRKSKINYLARMVFPILLLLVVMSIGLTDFLAGGAIGVVLIFIMFLMLLNFNGASVPPSEIESISITE